MHDPRTVENVQQAIETAATASSEYEGADDHRWSARERFEFIADTARDLIADSGLEIEDERAFEESVRYYSR